MIKEFLSKRFKKDINENEKRNLLDSVILFDIRNAIFSLFRNDLIKSFEYQSAIKSKPKPKKVL